MTEALIPVSGFPLS